jgi:ribosomal protein S12 methylthiotransferase accessory factor
MGMGADGTVIIPSMSNTFTVSFPGGVRVDASYKGLVVHTDQPAPLGESTAVSPFDLLLASIATCMGYYALRFCQERELSTEGLGLTLTSERDLERKRVSTIRIELTAPDGFPEQYESAILRAMDLCAVKKFVHEPPEFDLRVKLAAASR